MEILDAGKGSIHLTSVSFLTSENMDLLHVGLAIKLILQSFQIEEFRKLFLDPFIFIKLLSNKVFDGPIKILLLALTELLEGF